MKVQNFTNSNGNKAPNQFAITDDKGNEFFQSYNSVIVKKPGGWPTYPTNNPNNNIELDEHYWNYSKTTSKYRNIFLGETTKETKQKIKDGDYILTNLNQ